jgi:hypothetical protein
MARLKLVAPAGPSTALRGAVASVELSGPFFTRDPRKTVRQNIRRMLDALVKEGEEGVKAQMSAKAGSMPAWTGWTHDHVVGRTSSLSGKRWALNAVVSASTDGMGASEAIRTLAAAAVIERRFHPFRRVTSRMRRARAVLAANLSRGLE